MHSLYVSLMSVVCLDIHSDSKLLDIVYRISLKIFKGNIPKNSFPAKI